MHPMRVLVIDNTALFQQVIAKIFGDAGLETIAASSGEEALTILAQGNFDLVCCSYYLADTTGVDLCRRLRTKLFGRFLPFILLTAEKSGAVLRDAYVAGVTDIFEKQALDRLLTFIQRLLAQFEPIHGHVLIVEDSPALADFYSAMMRGFGLEVTASQSAEEALEFITHRDFDMVLSDIVLAGPMSGLTLVNQVRRISGIRGEVPILATTAFDDPARRIELFRLGVSDYVQKPVAAEELSARTRNLIAHFRLLKEVRSARAVAESEREQAYQELAYRATHDPVTGLGNRWAMEQQLATTLLDPEMAASHGLALIDIPTLQAVNDGAGHEAGDSLLKEIGLRVRRALPKDAFAARLEGSRIGVLLPGSTPAHAGAELELIVEAIEADDFSVSGHRYPLNVLAGGISTLSGIPSITVAMSRAETAITAATTAGASGLLIYDEADDRITARNREKHGLPDLLKALDGEAFALFMQRIAPLSAEDSGGYEFLCRMIGTDGTLRMPGDFMPTAERYQLMPRLDRLITRFALDWLGTQHHLHPDSRFFTINLSGQTFSDPGFSEFVRGELARSQAPAGKVYFEVTETSVMANPVMALAFMSEMHALGCRFALDDFGSGTASYAQLKRLPVQMLKIDGQFVRGMMTNPVDMAIIRSTCEVARVMQLTTVAEFIESEAEARLLIELGVDYGQGFGLGRPAPANV